MQKRFRWHLAVWLAASSLCGCRGTGSADRRGPPVTLFAAASASSALDDIGQEYERETGVNVQVSYAASSTLAQQIAHGAGADVFVSANTDWVDYLQRDENVLVQNRRDLLGNRLVMIVPADSPRNIRALEDLLDPSVRRVALADHTAVPAGIYAKAALVKLGLWGQLEEQGKIVDGADVRQALAYVETGAVEAGLVYATDAALSKNVRVVAEIPAELTEPICYPIVLLKHGAGKDGAESFYAYLKSPKAARIFRKHGFVVRGETAAGG